MEPETIDFKSGQLFPFHFQLLALVFILVGILSVIYMLFWSPILLLLGAFILSGFRGVDFNGREKIYREYNSFLFMKFGKWVKYDQAEKIYINSGSTSQKIYTQVTDGITVKSKEFNAYLKFDNGSKIYLASKKDKTRLIKRLQKLSDFFRLDILDNTI